MEMNVSFFPYLIISPANRKCFSPKVSEMVEAVISGWEEFTMVVKTVSLTNGIVIPPLVYHLAGS